MQPAQRAFVVGVGAGLRPQISYPLCCAHLSLEPCSHICWALLPYILLRWGFAPAPLSLRCGVLSWALVPRAMCISIGAYFLRAFRGPTDFRLVRSPLMSRAASSTGTWTDSSSTGRGRVVHRRIASVVCIACACTKACRHASMQVRRHAGMHAHRHMSTRAFMFADMQAYTHMQRLFRCAELLSMTPSPHVTVTHTEREILRIITHKEWLPGYALTSLCFAVTKLLKAEEGVQHILRLLS